MPRPVPSIPLAPEPWVSDCRAAAARLATVPAFEAAPRAPVPSAPPRGLRRAARAVAVWVLAPLAAWLVMSGAVLP